MTVQDALISIVLNGHPGLRTAGAALRSAEFIKGGEAAVSQEPLLASHHLLLVGGIFVEVATKGLPSQVHRALVALMACNQFV